MTTYTGTADANGDFNISFGGNSYASGQKVTITAEKNGATKSIELFAPADTTGGGAIQFSGTLNNFPVNVGVVTLSTEISGYIAAKCFAAELLGSRFGNYPTGLKILGAVTEIRSDAFYAWGNATLLILPNVLQYLRSSAFERWDKLAEIIIPNSVLAIDSYCFRYASLCKKITLGTSLSNIDSAAFSGAVACDEINCLRTTPPTIRSDTFLNLKATCVIKVPASSLAAYQTAANWSAHASKMVGV